VIRGSPELVTRRRRRRRLHRSPDTASTDAGRRFAPAPGFPPQAAAEQLRLKPVDIDAAAVLPRRFRRAPTDGARCRLIDARCGGSPFCSREHNLNASALHSS